jgi:SAM-dependent methyltransferase
MGAIAEAMATYLRYRRLELSVHPENVKATQFYLSTGWSRTKTAEETWDGNMWKNPTDESAAGLSAKIIGTEVTKIRREFERRDGICSNEEEVFDYASYLNRCLQRTVKRAIKSEALERARILDVGCGCGTLLRTLVSWGADRHKCYGIDLNEARIAVARRNIPGADLRLGDADLLPWSDSTFDIIIQSTVFSSILVNAMRIRIAREMVRTLKRDGVIVWYDLRMNNPGNPAVKGIRASEIAMLFMGEVLCWPCTLVPPISRRLIDRAPWLVSCLERVPLLCGHLGAVITRHRLES